MESPRIGSGGYALNKKCWKRRRSSIENMVGVDWSDGDSTSFDDSGGYSQVRPFRLQLAHSGSVSGHFTLRLLQLKQPFRDFLWPFLGMGLRRPSAPAGGG